MKIDRSLRIFGVLALFLAFAPFYPEPHLIGKIEWVMGGAVGMTAMDYFDLILHGGPLLIVLFLLGFTIRSQFKSNTFSRDFKKRSSHKTATEA